TASVLRQLNQAINEEALAGSALVAAQSGPRQLKTPLQLATENLRRAREGSAYRVLNSRPFSAMVLMMEAWNVKVALSDARQLELERGKGRLITGVGSTVVDLIIALEALTSKVVSNQSLLGAAGRPFLTLSEQRLEKI